MNKKKIAVITTCCLLAVGIVGGTYFLKTNQPAIIAATESESIPVSSVAESASSEEEYVTPPIPLPTKEELAAKSSRPKENTETITVNPDGTTTTEISRPEWSKPELTPPPVPDEPTTPDDPNGSKPEGDEPTADDPKPNTPEPPKGGDINHKGEMFVPGFGWTPIGDGNSGETVEMNPNGNIIGH